MASLDEVAKQVSGACDKASECKDALAAARDLVEDAHAALATALTDSVSDEAAVAQVLAAFTRVTVGIAELWSVLNGAMNRAQAIVDALTGGASPSSPRDAPPLGSSAARAVRSPDSSERIEALRREFPPSVVPRSGDKTHGRWIGPDGSARPIVSGKDEIYGEAIQVFKEMGSRHVPQRASDVEMKLAAHEETWNTRSCADRQPRAVSRSAGM
ncbi:hypothetical protein FHS29_006682 [Saccharothrix tamanrassetensis]|uniref:Uncharacterized protein n=1 Tax=Saccharothrix tamanrassetensis TaxID=1051531 RepID=A0A841CS32_9PSEU|nr:hypothetical protein [Saccharothrix tamanrassetensis]